MWFENSFRRHLLDMHIADWQDGVFLSEFSSDTYYENLKRARIKSAMIYFQSHVGYCYYPTKTGVMHSAFRDRPNALKELIDRCRAGGIDVVAYYSINYNTLESKRHPEWAAQRDSGVTESQAMFSGGRYGICCPNNPGYFQFVLDQVSEMLSYAEVDGIFFDMPFWQFPCRCQHCRERYRAEYGEEIPLQENTPEWFAFLRRREKWTGDYVSRLTAYVRTLKPDISVQYNYAYAVLNALNYIGSETINHNQDYASGDLYRGFLTQSFACKFYGAVTKNKPFEYMTGRCDPNLSCHTVTKSYDKLRLAMMLTVAHHGANLVIDAIDPVGTMDKRVYSLLGKLNEEVIRYEAYLHTGELTADIGLFYILEAKNDTTVEPADDYCHYQATISAAKAFTQQHIPYRIITQDTVDDLAELKAVVLANPRHLNDQTVEKLCAYVRQGGIVYMSGGADQPELFTRFFGAELAGLTDQTQTYLAPKPEYEQLFVGFNEKYPLPFQEKLPILQNVKNEDVLAYITLPYQHPTLPDAFSSIHSNPPGRSTEYPGVIIKPLGKGRMIWSAAGIEAQRPLVYQQLLCSLLRFAGLEESTVQTTASRNTEIILFTAEDQALVSAVYITDEEETEIQSPFEISVRTKRPKRVILLRDGREIEFSYRDGRTVFTTQPLDIFDMYQIVFE